MKGPDGYGVLVIARSPSSYRDGYHIHPIMYCSIKRSQYVYVSTPVDRPAHLVHRQPRRRHCPSSRPPGQPEQAGIRHLAAGCGGGSVGAVPVHVYGRLYVFRVWAPIQLEVLRPYDLASGFAKHKEVNMVRLRLIKYVFLEFVILFVNYI